MHLLPVESFIAGSSIDISIFEKESIRFSTIVPRAHPESRYNFDGFCTYNPSKTHGEEGVSHSYIQTFRNSCIESVTTTCFGLTQNTPKKINDSYKKILIDATDKYLKLLQSELEINPPILIMISLLGVSGYGVDDSHFRGNNYEIDRDHLIIPELFVQSYDEKVSDILRPAFDAIYQACGYPHSEN